MNTMKEKISRSDFISLIISILIPGIITSLVDFDVSMFGAYAVVGSLFGIRSIGIVFIVFFINHFINGIMGRIVIVSNRGPVELIRQYFGIKTSLWIFFVVLLLNFFSVIQIFAVIRIVSKLLDINFLLVVFCLLLYLTLILFFKIPKKFGYIIWCVGLFYVVIIAHASAHMKEVTASLSSWNALLAPFRTGNGLLYTFGLLGATVTAWSQMLISRYTYRDKINLDKLEYHVMENRTISVLSFLFAVVFVSVMGYLFSNGSLLDSHVVNLAKLTILFHSRFGEIFVSLGLFFLALTSFMAIVLSTSHTCIELFGKEQFNEETTLFSKTNGIFLAIFAIPAFIISLIVKVDFFESALLFGVAQSVFLIIEMRFLYILANDVSLMGRYKNDRIHNGALIIISAAVFLTIIRVAVQMIIHI